MDGLQQTVQLLIMCNSSSAASSAAASVASSASLSSSVNTTTTATAVNTTTPCTTNGTTSTPTSPLQSVIRWQLPLSSPYDRPSHLAHLMQLILAQCTPATFGRGNEAVLDTTYRSAYHLSPSNLVTSFHPAQFGCSILSDVARMVHPSTTSPFSTSSAVACELYALNVYCAGGVFRSHVDTPRSDDMFDSLVVLLPVPHTGGQLTVRHAQDERTFDWTWQSDETNERSKWRTRRGAVVVRRWVGSRVVAVTAPVVEMVVVVAAVVGV